MMRSDSSECISCRSGVKSRYLIAWTKAAPGLKCTTQVRGKRPGLSSNTSLVTRTTARQRDDHWCSLCRVCKNARICCTSETHEPMPYRYAGIYRLSDMMWTRPHTNSHDDHIMFRAFLRLLSFRISSAPIRISSLSIFPRGAPSPPRPPHWMLNCAALCPATGERDAFAAVALRGPATPAAVRPEPLLADARGETRGSG